MVSIIFQLTIYTKNTHYLFQLRRAMPTRVPSNFLTDSLCTVLYDYSSYKWVSSLLKFIASQTIVLTLFIHYFMNWLSFAYL